MEKAFGENGAYLSLLDAQGQGKIGHIGITSHNADMLKIVMEKYDVETVIYPYSIVVE